MAVIRKNALSFKCGNFAKRYPDHEANDLLREAEALIEEMESEMEELRAARQPVGQEPVGYFDPDVLAHLSEGLIDPVGVLRRKPNGKSNVPVWLTPPAQAVDLGLQLDRYDTGLLGDGGGGDVAWWQDYIRAELDRAHEFYQDQADHA